MPEQAHNDVIEAFFEIYVRLAPVKERDSVLQY
jgi:hypothetical protein